MGTRVRKLRIALLCGGPSAERGISLNSARSISDHLIDDDIEVLPIYYDYLRRPFRISRAQLYSNTPQDFDFKLQEEAQPLSRAALLRLLSTADLSFPVIHGRFGEDGEIQSMLERARCRVIGPSASSCRTCFDKYNVSEVLRDNGFYSMPVQILLRSKSHEASKQIDGFFKRHKLARAVIKPALGGSSIGVSSVTTVHDAVDHTLRLFSEGYSRVVCEPFCEGREFTVVLLENRVGLPVCLVPVEIETDYSGDQIFDYRKKYLPTRQASYHCPPRFEDGVIERIQAQAEQLFHLFGLRDFSRFDGWVTNTGDIWFSDFNPISGMEQNSFLFLQGARLGMTHRDVARWIVRSACRRYGIKFLEPVLSKRKAPKKRVSVIFGGDTAERQVSVMSGTNVWLKLMRSKQYLPQPFLLDFDRSVWKLPYGLTLYHTVEEIAELCRTARATEKRLKPLRDRVLAKLGAKIGDISEHDFIPEKLTINEFAKASEFVFIGLHGGWGEDGRCQALLERYGVPFNGARSKTSRLCMDKAATGRAIARLRRFGIYTAKREELSTSSLIKRKPPQLEIIWAQLLKKLGGSSVIVKPNDDGCSAGVVRLHSSSDLEKYLWHLSKRVVRIPRGTLSHQSGIVEMPSHVPASLLFETFIETDEVSVERGRLVWRHVNGWVEITVGVLGKKRSMKSLNPSITVSVGDVLSVEEKFQGGTGVNITPPPEEFVSESVRRKAMRRIERVARALALEGYARIDAFMSIKTGEIIVIEANSLPGLTPSTVIYHQALAQKPPLYPTEFLETIVKLGSQ